MSNDTQIERCRVYYGVLPFEVPTYVARDIGARPNAVLTIDQVTQLEHYARAMSVVRIAINQAQRQAVASSN